MSARVCPRCAKALPAATLRAVTQGTWCPFCNAPIKAMPRKTLTGQHPIGDDYAGFQVSQTPAPATPAPSKPPAPLATAPAPPSSKAPAPPPPEPPAKSVTPPPSAAAPPPSPSPWARAAVAPPAAEAAPPSRPAAHMTAIVPASARRAAPPATLATLVDSPRDKRRAVFAGAGALLIALALVLVFRSGSSRHGAVVLPTAPKLESVAQIQDLPPPEQVAPAAEPVPAAPPAPPRTTRKPAVAQHAGHSKSTKSGVARGARAKRAARRVAMAKGGAAPRGVGADAGDPRPSYERGTSHLLAGDDAGAIAAFRDAVHKAPHEPIGYRGLGLAYEQKGDTAAAVRALRQYLKLAPSASDRAIIVRRIDRLSKATARK